MIRTNRFYTIWVKRDGQDADIVEECNIIHSKFYAFLYAHMLAKDLGDECTVLVRRVTVGSDICTEWEFNN